MPRIYKVFISLTLLAIANSFLIAQSPSPSSSNSSAQQSVQDSLVKMKSIFASGNIPQKVMLSGTVHLVRGALDKQGNITMIAGSDGSYQINSDLGVGAATEIQTSITDGRSCNWSDNSGNQHAVSSSNCQLGIAWFLPEIAIFGGQQPTTTVLGINPSVIVNGVSLVDLEQYSTDPAEDIATLLKKLSLVDVLIDPNSYLPAIIRYSLHSENRASINIPVEIYFSNYQLVSGIQIPLHIQRYLNGILEQDITISSAVAQ